MTKKNMKVIIMTAKTSNGNDLTYRTLCPLDFTVADACKMRNIPMLSILSTIITAPMTEKDAIAYLQKHTVDTLLDPCVRLVKSSFAVIAA